VKEGSHFFLDKAELILGLLYVPVLCFSCSLNLLPSLDTAYRIALLLQCKLIPSTFTQKTEGYQGWFFTVTVGCKIWQKSVW